jgi:nucleotide-binding universal stress UspA family protein
MFRRVLVPLDGSPRAESALSSACAIARTFKAEVSLVRVAGVPVGSTRSYSDSDEHRDVESYLNGVARKVAASGLCVSTQIRSGDVPGAILGEIDEERADLVVIGTRGHVGWLHGEHGSVAREVLSWSRVPVMVQREGARPVDSVGTVLVPLDGTPASVPALAAGVELAHATAAELVVLNVMEPIPSWMHEVPFGSSTDRPGIAPRSRAPDDMCTNWCSGCVTTGYPWRARSPVGTRHQPSSRPPNAQTWFCS